MAVIVMANQKGGVGKSTVAILYANHLAELNKDVLIVETDAQKSIYNQREGDVRVWGEDAMNYRVEYFNLETMEKAEEVIMSAKSLPATVIIDVPGNITDDYIAPLLVYADFIVCPYQYENKCLDSTGVFIQVCEKLKKKFPKETENQKMIYIPNSVDSRFGTKEELEYWKNIDNVFSEHGIVTPQIPYRADLKRTNTYINTPKQKEQTNQCFEFIDHLVFGKHK
jgi:chromosome partitioning protein